MNSKPTIIFASGLFLGIAGIPAMAAETSVSVKAGGTYSDNIRRSSTLEESEALGVIGLKLISEKDDGRLVGSIDADLEFHKYLDDTYDDDNFSTLSAFAELRVVPDRFSWVVQENFGRTISDPFQSDTPMNREWVNSFSTGPNLQLQFGNRTSMKIEGRLIQNDFETSNVDNQVTSGTISLIRATSPTRSVSVNINGTRIEFDDIATNGAFDRQSAYVGLQSRLARSNLSLNLGVNQIHDRGGSKNGLLAQVRWTREVSASSSFSASLNQRYAEAGELFSFYQGSGRDFNRTQDISAIGEPLQNQRFELRYDLNRENNEAYLGVSWNDDDFEYTNIYDRQRRSVNAGIRRNIAENWQIGGDIQFEQHDFQDTDISRGYDETRVRAVLSRRLSGNLSVNIMADRNRRTADGQVNSYVENRYSIFLTYAVR